MIVFGMAENDNDTEEVKRLLQDLKMDKRVVKLERMRKREGEETTVKPVIVELESEKDKWEVLERKADLRKEKKWEKVFLELDLSREKREERKQRMTEKRKGQKMKERGKEEKDEEDK